MWWRRNKNSCGYWDCKQRLPDNQFLCEEHYQHWEVGTLDRCPKCGRFKDVQYHLCQDCYFGRRVAQWQPAVALPAPTRSYKVVFSATWTDGYLEPKRVFVYLLEFADGSFYVDTTTDIRKRFSEHRDGKIRVSAGRNPKLQYMEIAINQRAAELRQIELKRLTETNPHQIQLMIHQFHDHLAALEV